MADTPTTDPVAEVAEEFGSKFEDALGRMEALGEELEHARDNSDAKAVSEKTAQIAELNGQIEELTTKREAAFQEAQQKAMKGQIETLQEAVRKANETAGARLYSGQQQEDADNPYSQKSFYADAREVLKSGNPQATQRWEEALSMEGKAMTESVSGSAGGFLVPDQIADEVLELRAQRAVLRGLFSSISVNSDVLRIASVTGGLAAGWVAELGAKPNNDLTFGEISVNTFTAAGMATASNQLLRDARRSVDSLVNADLALRLGNLEEVAFISGSGTGQPQGILNTSGINTVTLTPTDIPTLLDAVVDAITAIYSNYFGGPNAIVMHPRTWARIVKARESASPTAYIVGPPGGVGRRASDDLPGYSAAQTPRGELFGLPVYTTANIPTNLGAGTNESRIIVGNFSEGLILEHEGIQLAESPHVFFTTNQTVFRAEMQVGFTAARYPKAFSVVQGAGLAAG